LTVLPGKRFFNSLYTAFEIPSQPGQNLRAARANRDFCADEKRIRAEITVMDKSKGGLGLVLSKIADGARMCFSSVRYR
jgi:hypothetical protein